MINKEFIKLLLLSSDNISSAISAHFKVEYLDYDNKSYSCVRELYTVIVDFYNKYRRVITSLEIEQFLRSRNRTDDQIKDLLLLFEEISLVTSTKNFDFIIDEIKGAYAKNVLHKQLIASADNLIKNDLESALVSIKEGLFRAEETLLNELSQCSVTEVVGEVVQDYKDIKSGLIKPGLDTGFPTLDRLSGGLKPGELSVVIAGPSGGKSTMMLNIGYNIQTILGKNILFMSLELPRKQILRRYYSLASGLICNDLRDGTLSPEDEETYKKTLSSAKDVKGQFYIVDQPMCTAQNIAAKITEVSSKFPIDLVIVDYLGLMKPSIATGQGWQDIGATALELRKVARFFKVPILTAMQVSKESQKNVKTATYDMTDIALSFAVNYHADMVITLKAEKKDELNLGVSSVDINGTLTKCRDGNRGNFNINAAYDRMRMVERL